MQSSGGDVLAELLDAEQVHTSRSNCFAVLIVTRIEQGSQVRDTGIFRAHAARYEAEFLEDMTRLGAEPPLSHVCTLLTFCRLQAVLCPTFSPA